MKSLFSWCALSCALASPLALATPLNVIEGIGELKQELVKEHGFSQEEVDQWFANTEFADTTIELYSRQPEKTKTIKEYKPLFVNPDRLAKGKVFYSEHRQAFDGAEKEYGVPGAIILSILGMETRFGTYTGKHQVFSALATLAVQHPREKSRPYFRREFVAFLNIAKQQGMDPLSIKGSYAGAMGLPQFMPTSYLGYAADGDGDGLIDIWNNPTDAIYSVARYLKKNGWQSGEPIVLEASVSGEKFAEFQQTSARLSYTLGEVQAAGWQAHVPANLTPDDKVMTFEVKAEGGQQYWMGLKNFYVITRYNQSIRYALTVHLFAEALKEEVKEP